MARARNIKPSFFQNEELAELDPLARLFFIGLWTVADYKGCVEFRPKRLKVQLLPYDDCDTESIAKNLEDSGFVLIYSVEGKRYLKVVNFEKHQNPHKNERDGGSEIPDIDKAEPQVVENKEIENNRDKNGTAQECDGIDPADSPFLIPDSLNPLPPYCEQGASLPGSPPGKPARFDPLKIELPACIPADAWGEWIAYRRSRNLTVSEKTMKAQVGKLAEWHAAGHSPADIIATSVTNGWQGLFEPKAPQGRTPPRDDRHRASYDRTADNELMRRQMEALGIEPYDGEF